MTAMPFQPIGHTLRLHRFETVAFGLLAVLGVILAFLVAARLDAVGYGVECVLAMREGGASPRGCELKANEFYDIVSREAGLVSALLTFVPFVSALLIGVAVVGREIERGTTRLAWALTPSRLRWLAHRLAPVLVVVAVIGLLMGVAADRLLAATEPGMDPANALAQLGQRGPVLAARAIFVMSIGVVVGAVMGRALPALVVATVIAVVGIAGGSQVHDGILRSEATVIEQAGPGDRYFDQLFVLPGGRLVGWDEIEQHDPPPATFEDTTVWPTLPQVTLGISGTRYGDVQLREIGALAGGTLVALLLTALVVQRRRPG